MDNYWQTSPFSFLRVFSHWQAYVTGGAVTAIIAIIERKANRQISWQAYRWVVFAFFAVSVFLVWRDAYREIESMTKLLNTAKKPNKIGSNNLPETIQESKGDNSPNIVTRGANSPVTTGPNSPITTFNVFAGPPESMTPSIQTFLQNPKYRSMTILPGPPLATFRFNSPSGEFAYSFSVPVLDGEPAVLIKVADELAERVFRLNPKSFSPFTVHIQTKGCQFLLAVEGITPQGVRVRTFGP